MGTDADVEWEVTIPSTRPQKVPIPEEMPEEVPVKEVISGQTDKKC